MALRTPPSWLQNGSHPAENDRLTTQAYWKTTGLLSTTDMQITQNGTPNMSINVSSGWAAIVGTTQTNMGTYIAYNDATQNLVVTTANPTNPRIDLVVVTVSDSYYTGSTNTVAFSVIAGTPAVSPTVPTTPANSIALGQIAVAANVTSIVTANITNYGVLATSNFSRATLGALTSPKEVTTISATAATGTIQFDYSTQGVLYYTTNASGAFTLNLRGNSTTTFNSITNTGEAATFVFMNTNGATPYYTATLTIDGNSQTVKWQNGTAPTSGNASSVDIYTFTVVKTASATFTVIGSQTKFA
jgi:hypothetical protein